MMTYWLDTRRRECVLIGSVLCLVLASAPARAQQCVGDCNGSDSVGINELIIGVDIAQGTLPLSLCPSFDCEHNDMVPISCLIQAVNNALNGCGPACPLAAGSYTITQTAGGTLTVSTLSAFPFPAGGTIVTDVSAASSPECLHSVVVPFPGGLSVPVFCIPSLGLTSMLTQRGCGIGQIDSNGGADYTVVELGDTSSQPVCNNQQVCTTGVDSKVRVDITVGDGSADTCSAGTGNAIVSIPVRTVAWLEKSSGPSCPANDGMFNPQQGDVLVLDVNQILDFTTDTNDAQWRDLSGDGCALAGAGPASGLSSHGTCMDLTAKTVAIAASGTVGSAGGPLFDFTFTTRLPNTISDPNPALGSSCESPPIIDFNGTAIRCLE